MKTRHISSTNASSGSGRSLAIHGERLISAWSRLAMLLICIILFANAVVGQSLSIKKVDTNYWIEANATVDDPHTLQASENLHLWVDIHDQVQEPYSFAFDNTGVSDRYFRLTPAAPEAPPIRIVVIGDSMSSDCCGWGA